MYMSKPLVNASPLIDRLFRNEFICNIVGFICVCCDPPKAIETALDCLKSANTEPYYRRQAWEVIKCFLVAMTSLDDNKHALYQLLSHPK